jgi:uncharacterized protein YndB with AHSA1/START domain
MHGTYETVDGQPAVRFERRLAHPIEKVWRSVTEPEELVNWFPQVPGIEREIIENEPPRLLSFRWGADLLRFELSEDGDGTLLRLTHVLGSADQAARDAAGWHVCLDRLERSLGGEDTAAPGSEPTGEWREHYEEYERRGLPTGAPVPSG